MQKSILLVLVLALAPGCAFLDYDNLRLVKSLDNMTRWVDTPVEQVALLPVSVPVCAAASLVDVLIIHPVTQIPGAAKRTHELLWESKIDSFYLKVLLVIPALVATPIYFTADWLIHSALDFDW
jgi:hypothetical protein